MRESGNERTISVESRWLNETKRDHTSVCGNRKVLMQERKVKTPEDAWTLKPRVVVWLNNSECFPRKRTTKGIQ